MRKMITFLVCITLAVSPVLADVDALLDNIVYGASYQGANTIVSPTRTTYTLGSLSFRLRNDLLDQPIFSFQPPRATLSCSGADFDAGWLSIMNLSTFSDLIQQAGTQFMWGIVVGLAYSLPGIATSFDWLQKWGRMAQQLAGNMCNIGISVGKNLGSALFESKKTEAAEAGVGSGNFSAFTESFKAFQQFFDMAGFFGAYPVDVLENAGWMDDEVRSLIATATGILVWFPVDENGNICTSTSCIKGRSNVYVYFYESKPDVLRQLIRGGNNVEVYDCNYTVYAGGWGTCKDGVVSTRTINTEGLAAKIGEKLRNVRDTMLGGSWTGSPSDPDTQFVASMSYFYPNLPKVINAAALLKKKGYTALSDTVINAYAEMLAVHLLQSLIISMQSKLFAVKGLYMLDKKLPEDVATKLSGISKTADRLRAYLKDAYTEVNRVQDAVNRTLTIEALIQEAALEKFGRSAALFLRR